MNKITREGITYYPVGRWETYQHVFYNANDRAILALYDAEESGDVDAMEKADDWMEIVQRMLTKWNFNPRVSGIVYAEYKDYKVMKDIIGSYAARHGGTV